MIKQISHVGLAVRNLEQVRELYDKVFGLHPSPSFIGGKGDMKVSLVNVGSATLELLQPVGSEGVIARFLEKRGEGIHHICYEVDDIDAEVELLKSQGIEVLGKPEPGAEGRSLFLHPKSTHGVLVELVQKT